MSKNPESEPQRPSRVEDDPDASGLTERIAEATAVLEQVVEDRGHLARLDPELRERFLIAAGRVSRPDKRMRKALAKAHRRREKVEKRDEKRQLLATTGIRKLRENPIFKTPRRRGLPLPGPLVAVGEVDEGRTCYVCREKYTQIHWFYDQMCLECGDFNYAKRTPQGDLRGRVALVTGARVKIGYQAAIMLLRSGCSVIVTTRFPRDAARRYASEADFAEWGERLEIHGIDLRHVPSVEALCERLCATHERLDFIISNACQTVRRPPGFYDHLMDGERELALSGSDVERRLVSWADEDADRRRALAEPLPGGYRAPVLGVSAAELSQVALVAEDLDRGEHLFPAGRLDADEQQVDLREVNSWRLKLAEVPTVELLEVHLVNAVAPFLLNARLKPLMLAVPTRDKHIVNVSAMEGQFYRTYKGDRHPHTNMAKASLNMMTRTSAADYVKDGIHMNSVDTGWVTDEDPMSHAVVKREMHGFHPPLDIVDGAARIVDPIFDGLATGRHVWGQFLKDYRETDW